MVTKPDNRLSLDECSKHLPGHGLSEDELKELRDSLYLILGRFVEEHFASLRSKLPKKADNQSEVFSNEDSY